MRRVRMSVDFADAPEHHEVLVIGSGYGGGVAACRLARAGLQVSVLERGQEWLSGEFPNDVVTGIGEFQTTLGRTGETYGKPYGLYDIRVSDNVNCFIGCGLGGTSLINANVAIEADERSLARWPAPYNASGALTDYYARAREMLGSTPYPAEKTLPKLEAMAEVAEGLGVPLERPDINVTFKAGENAAGVWRNPCVDCGDCCSGCNHDAKSTVDVTYLADAYAWQAALYVGADVQQVLPSDTGWSVWVKDTASGEVRVLQAARVVLAAGTLGSTEILLRSKKAGLSVSDKLGAQFSSNGDVWAFAYNANRPDEDRVGVEAPRKPVYCVGAGDAPDPDRPSRKPGPCITGVVKVGHESDRLDERLIIEEGAMPGALAPIYAGFLPMQDVLQGDYFRQGDVGTRMQDFAWLGEQFKANPTGFAETAYTGPVSRTLPFLVMNHDTASGTLALGAKDRVRVDWKGAGRDPAFAHSDRALRKAADALKAEYLPMPMWEDAFDRRVTVVHPLGGCPMGADVTAGVVNADCQVFAASGALHPGLFVMDGSVLPSAIGVNPHLTITAVAERAVARMAEVEGWEIKDGSPPPVDRMEPTKEEPVDFTGALQGALRYLEDLHDRLGRCPKVLLRRYLRQSWGRLLEEYGKLPADLRAQFPMPGAKHFVNYIAKGDGMRSVLRPIVKQCIDALKPVVTQMETGDPIKAVELLETAIGAFSPPLSFDEQMRGHVSDVGLGDSGLRHGTYQSAAMGAENFVFDAHIWADHVQDLLREGGKQGHIQGTATWTVRSETRVYAVDGQFKFLIQNFDEIECWNMVYEGTMRSPDGRALQYKGVKTLQLREGSHWWTDLTELYFDIYDQELVVARGIISIGLEDVIKQANEISVAFPDGALEGGLENAYGAVKRVVTEGDRAALVDVVKDTGWRTAALLGALHLGDALGNKTGKRTEQLYQAQVLGKFGVLIVRVYGRFLSYMANFPAHTEPRSETETILPDPVVYTTQSADGIEVKLTRYEGGTKGPVLVAAGFGAISSTFATPTVKRNLVQELYDDGFDIWLFDYRGSGDLPASLTTFDMDDVINEDFPAAITEILRVRTDVKDVQVVVHCVGSLLMFMAMLAGEQRVRSVVSSQLGPHTLINWFKYAQADGQMADYVRNGLPKKMWPLVEMMELDEALEEAIKKGLKVVDPCSGPDPTALDQAIDGLIWQVPNFAPVVCNNPTCHRINFYFGPTYQHENLNQATHNAIGDMFGAMSSAPFAQIARCFATGHAVSNSRDIDYMAHPERLRMPIFFIAGAKNPLMIPECSLRTLDWLQDENADVAERYSRKVYQDYGHIDCFIGRNAATDIFPDILEHLNTYHDFDRSEDVDASG